MIESYKIVEVSNDTSTNNTYVLVEFYDENDNLILTEEFIMQIPKNATVVIKDENGNATGEIEIIDVDYIDRMHSNIKRFIITANNKNFTGDLTNRDITGNLKRRRDNNDRKGILTDLKKEVNIKRNKRYIPPRMPGLRTLWQGPRRTR